MKPKPGIEVWLTRDQNPLGAVVIHAMQPNDKKNFDREGYWNPIRSPLYFDENKADLVDLRKFNGNKIIKGRLVFIPEE
ncbi:MAG: hypothetical protein CV087_23870 [Candidatus Brocadia sp. WS118]|nr:MAG: hypothetical protein CV087_23870 [Candidatus Brocadia sp. WS118]